MNYFFKSIVLRKLLVLVNYFSQLLEFQLIIPWEMSINGQIHRSQDISKNDFWVLIKKQNSGMGTNGWPCVSHYTSSYCRAMFNFEQVFSGCQGKHSWCLLQQTHLTTKERKKSHRHYFLYSLTCCQPWVMKLYLIYLFFFK